MSDTNTPKGLIIEDDSNIIELVGLEVTDIGYQLDYAEDGVRGVEMALANEYAFVLLDIMLPGIEGVEVLKQIREVNKRLPVIMLTARKDDVSKVMLLELGADDFISKPFNPLELKARIKAVLRRSESQVDSAESQSDGGVVGPETRGTLHVGDLEIDLDKRQVKVKGQAVELTPMEFRILSLLASRPDRPYSKSEITSYALGYQTDGYDKSVSSHINRLRRKLEPDMNKPIYIMTARGHGYYLVGGE